MILASTRTFLKNKTKNKIFAPIAPRGHGKQVRLEGYFPLEHTHSPGGEYKNYLMMGLLYFMCTLFKYMFVHSISISVLMQIRRLNSKREVYGL